MLNVTIVGDREVITQLKAMPQNVTRELNREALYLADKLRNHIILHKLSGQVLNKRTGNLQRSIKSKVETNPGVSVVGKAFSSGDVKYAGIHEFGGMTKAHIIEPKHARALAFEVGGKTIIRRRVNHPGSKMPERSFMRSSLTDLTPDIIKGFTQAVMRGAKQ